MALNFKSSDGETAKQKYLKWLAYVKMHNLAKHHTAIKLNGKPHKVKHSK